ncbi:hypothetical protein, partial [Actinomadura roseirufa]|uniref:hypothetical protein n=1 Tax=Actinomadura roseirufa TaxID=2094049 RepID=UPI0010412B46
MNGPWTRLARTQWAPLAALAVLTLVTALLAVTVPSRIAAGYDGAAGAAVGADGEVRVEAKVSAAEGGRSIPTGVETTTASALWQGLLPPSLRAVAGPPEPSIALDEDRVSGARTSAPLVVTLKWDLGTRERIRFVAGAPPENRPSDDSDDDHGRVIEIAVPKAFGAAYGYAPGSDLVFAGGVRARVSGLYEAVNERDPYWTTRGLLLRPRTEPRGVEGVRFEVGAGLIDLGAYTMLLHGPDRQLTYSWRFPLLRDRLDTARASTMAADLEAFRAALKNRTDFFECAVVTALDARLRAYAGQLRTARAVLGLALGGLAAVAAGALLLAAGLLAERLEPVQGTMRARGASLRQLVPPACALTALAVLPAAALGYAAGRFLDAGPPQASSLWTIGALLVLVLALPAAMIVRRQGGATAAPARRDD